jgi:hypothetical protein
MTQKADQTDRKLGLCAPTRAQRGPVEGKSGLGLNDHAGILPRRSSGVKRTGMGALFGNLATR